MTLTAMILIISSALLLAGWNLISKREYPTSAFFLFALLPDILLCGVLYIIFPTQFAAIPGKTWQLILASSLMQALYLASLAGAYRAEDVSIMFPVTRALSIILVTLISLFLRGSGQLSSLALLGMGLIVAGCVLLPNPTFKHISIRRYFSKAPGFLLLTAISTAGYYVLDDMALRILRSSPHITISDIWITFIYLSLVFAFTLAWLGLFVVLQKDSRQEIRSILPGKLRGALSVGISIILGALAAMLAMAHVRDVSYVAAFNQVSVVIGLVFAVFFLKEKAHPPKVWGTLAVFAGLVLVGLG